MNTYEISTLIDGVPIDNTTAAPAAGGATPGGAAGALAALQGGGATAGVSLLTCYIVITGAQNKIIKVMQAKKVPLAQ